MKYRQMHDDLRNYVEILRRRHLFDWMAPNQRLATVALELTRFGIGYGLGEDDLYGGAFYQFHRADGPATFKWKYPKWGEAPPGLECAGFVEAALYAAGITGGRILTYRGLRDVSEKTKLYQEASAGESDYVVHWIPKYRDGKQIRRTITQDAGLTEAWPNTPQLTFFRQEFVPRYQSIYPHIGDLVFFQYKDARGWHVHVGIWGHFHGEDGLIHSSPKWGNKSKTSGPKFTPTNDPYYKRFLYPQRNSWSEWFGTSVVKLKEAK